MIPRRISPAVGALVRLWDNDDAVSRLTMERHYSIEIVRARHPFNRKLRWRDAQAGFEVLKLYGIKAYSR